MILELFNSRRQLDENRKTFKKQDAICPSWTTDRTLVNQVVSNTDLPSEAPDHLRNFGEQIYNAFRKGEGEQSFRVGKAGIKTS